MTEITRETSECYISLFVIISRACNYFHCSMVLPLSLLKLCQPEGVSLVLGMSNAAAEGFWSGSLLVLEQTRNFPSLTDLEIL